MAASVSAFMSSVLSGITTDPVSKNINTKMMRLIATTTTGALCSRLCFWSMKRAVVPETRISAPGGGRSARMALTASWAEPSRAGSFSATFR